MPLVLTDFVDGDTISAAEMRARFLEIRRFLNGEITAADIEPTPWIRSHHIFRPEFYGSPSPRARLVSGSVLYRRGAQASNLQAGSPDGRVYFHPEVTAEFRSIPSLCATFDVTADNTAVDVLVTFYTFQYGGLLSPEVYDDDTHECAEFKLFEDGAELSYTSRFLYADNQASGPGSYPSRKQHTMAASLLLDRGTHSVGVRCKPYPRADFADQDTYHHIFVDARSLVISCMVK